MFLASVANALLPHACAKRIERWREFRRLGMPGARAVAALTAPRTWSSYLEARLNLLPDAFAQSVPIVVDVGANRGDWSKTIMRMLNPGRLIAIEPNPEMFAIASNRLSRYPTAECLNFGVGSQTTELPLHVTAGSQCASLLKPGREMTSLYGDSFVEQKTIMVEIRPLDEILRDCHALSLLKIDVQGYEREALAGARATLDKTDLVLIEVNFVSHYENDIRFAELDSLMSSHGFALANLSPPFIRQGRALWADALYRKL